MYNTDNYVENLLQFECSVDMKIERWQLPLFDGLFSTHKSLQFNQRSTFM